MLASDILPPRTVSSRGMMGMLKRLETDSPNNYIFKLVPPSPSRSARGRERAQRCSQGMPPGNPLSRLAGEGQGEGDRGGQKVGAPQSTTNWSWLPKSASNSSTGLAFLYTKTENTPHQPRLAIAPPFPIKTETETTDRETLIQSINPPLHIAIILIRYGYVAIAIAHDETLVLTKTETRWVPNKHRAGGQSANRFKRSREKWAREFFDKSAALAQDRFSTYPHKIDHLIFGGDKHVINQFLDRATLPNNLADRILQRRLNTLRPNRNALKDAVRQAWSSTIYELASPASTSSEGKLE